MVFDTTMDGYQFTQKVYVCTMYIVRTSVCALQYQHVIFDFGYSLSFRSMENGQLKIFGIRYMHKIWNRWAHWHSMQVVGKEIQGIDIQRQTNKSCSKHFIPCLKSNSIDIVKSTFWLAFIACEYFRYQLILHKFTHQLNRTCCIDPIESTTRIKESFQLKSTSKFWSAFSGIFIIKIENWFMEKL